MQLALTLAILAASSSAMSIKAEILEGNYAHNNCGFTDAFEDCREEAYLGDASYPSEANYNWCVGGAEVASLSLNSCPL